MNLLNLQIDDQDTINTYFADANEPKRDFQQCGIFTSVDESVQPPFKA